MAVFICGFLIFAYFVVEIIDTGFPQFYYAAYLEYGQFVSGYGSVTILTEMLSLFFTYRAYKIPAKVISPYYLVLISDLTNRTSGLLSDYGKKRKS